jgi:outer membrane receptor protein involved in Fe transport
MGAMLIGEADFRAPTLYDLYQPTTVSTTAFSDTLTGGLVPATVYTGGNVNLKPETGDTTSAGFVFRPVGCRVSVFRLTAITSI